MNVIGTRPSVSGLDAEVQKLSCEPSGLAAMEAIVRLQASMNPGIWAVARALDAVRRTDKAAEKAWQDRLRHRLDGCREIVRRLRAEGVLKPDLSEGVAAEPLWNVTSFRTWEDLVLERKWSPERYVERITRLLRDALTNQPASS